MLEAISVCFVSLWRSWRNFANAANDERCRAAVAGLGKAEVMDATSSLH